MMYKGLVFVVALIGHSVLSGAQVLEAGQCDTTIAVADNYDVTQFSGTWYEISRTPNAYQTADCSTFTFTTGGAGALTVASNAVDSNFAAPVTGSATYGAEPAKLVLNLSPFPNEIDFWILTTDHENYALAYSCENVDANTRSINLWKLGRASTYATVLMNSLLDTTIFNVLGINATETMIDMDHSEQACYVLPVIEAGQAVVLDGQCDDTIPVQQNFDAVRFLGRWHEIYSYYSENAFGACYNAFYSLNADGSVGIVNSQVVNQALLTINGFAVVSSNDGSGLLSVTLEVVPGVFAEQELKILTTDYDNYAITYSCTNVSALQKRVYSWIVSRTKQLSAESQTYVDAFVNSYLDLNYNYYYPADQSENGCFYFPEPTGSPVIFPGTCDQSIPAVTNFDPVAYMGLWHEIEGYPSTFQQGTCNNAFYTLVDGTVDVYNTQVINQSLDTIDGVAVIASTDGSAKLTVTFPVVGTNQTVSTSYWVLGTDYSTYALVYTCEDLGNDQRALFSWKLSRTKQMPATATTAINNIISTIPVLDARYYEAKDQSVDGCFYFPQAVAATPVVFPGQCDDTIQAVAGFDLSQFSGSWYEIQAYPKDEQNGQCISHAFTLSGTNALSLISNQIVDQFLYVTNSSVGFSSTDGSGRLVITLNSGGTEIIIPFWILSIDYNSYAFAYSCVNVDTDFRAIYSWKLSRTSTGLTTAANTAIDSVIANNIVLDNSYFEDVSHSDESCFYLPELEAGAPIILSGQCDVTIPAMQNFDPTRYTGRWRLIESYPSAFQDGTCNDATYTLENGIVLVYNTQVVNQTLDTIDGTAVLASTDGSGKLLVTFPIAGTAETISLEYWILDTDYETYSLVYSCSNINSEERQIWSWKMSRTRELTAAATTAINQVVDTVNVLNNRYYEVVDNSDTGCFYFPDPVAGQTVTFRGQCDLTIPALPNFDPVAYMGLWHEIEGYPSTYQEGSCNNAFYTLVNGTVDVYNTQVINQTLDEIDGVAVIAPDDGSAKLTVTFPIVGTEFTLSTSYWVLATDYETYALVYTCTNLNDEEIAVFSWKLSRTKALTAAANTNINNVMNSIQVLDQRYFEVTDQSTDGCFYYPEPVIGQPVVFPGQCDETIATVANFDLDQFSGFWYEISAYPKEFGISGSCLNYDFTVSTANSFTLITNGVSNFDLQTSSATVVQSTTDGSAKFTITVISNGQEIVIPYWILATDYQNHALAYSCVNLNNDFRAVYSWKLGRNNVLSAASNTAISQVIDSVVVLEEQYFEATGQTDNDCFYLPNISLNEPAVFVGQCDENIPAVANFDPVRYGGRWFDIQSYYDEFQQGTCNDALYTLTPEGTVDVYNTQVVSQALDTINGTAVLASTDGSGKLLVTFPIAGTDLTIDASYWILDTDYDSYSLVYSCRNIDANSRRVNSWKLSRTRELTAPANNAINAIVETIPVLNDRFYIQRDHSDAACFYFPDPVDGQAVTFRGQCDENVQVVQNFDAVAYMGLWYEIEGYPSAFQQGSCNNAFYTLVDGTVDVYNTQVINQTLDEINGVAVIASDDGSAKLLVTFPVVGTDFSITTNYWVLATDYESYALVYTCENINAEQRTVWSWKLSRTKALSVAATTTINTAMNAVQVLEQQYYRTTDQTEEGCFYYPEPVIGRPVVFPGQCDDSIPAVANFDLNLFQGLWHEISAYPKDFGLEGQCLNYDFTVSTATSFSMITNAVSGLALETSTASVVQSATDGSGRFTITVTSGGQNIVIPYWILDTDYDSYALAYSCVNLNNDFRGVYSWKLGRTKTLSAAANQAITQTINSIVVLEDQYFETTSQTDDSCFYLPNISLNEPAVFVGQCDESIPAVANFDPVRYGGRWFDIQSYYDEFQQGTCNDALYTLTPEGTVDVYNTQVVSQALDTINGTAVLASTDGSGKLLVTFPVAGTNFTVDAEYWILDTDYDSYSLVYSCRNLNAETRRVNSWKLSRSRELTPAASTAIDAIVDSINVLNDQFFIQRDHSDAGCFYYPEPVSGQAVLFRGQCDVNVAVVQNFDAAAYMGLWYDVGSYPQEFQDGTCPTATYTLNPEGFVEVYNTQVVNQQLDDINGIAVVASTDGSAQLAVTFPVANTEFTIDSPYWVLSTDYENYALVYACINVNEEYRRVTSWKLSRTTSLTAASETAINNVLNQVEVLDERYFENRGHTEADCFFYPDNLGGPVYLDGVCTEPDVVSNFDTNQFTGEWFESARFPSELQTGNCSSSQFQFNNNVISITTTGVFNERIIEVTGTATVSTDGRGILTASLIYPDGSTQNLNLYVLDTDYTDYALLYSCRTVDTTTKQVYSWKLSRNQDGISTNANQNIDAIVSAKDDLFEGYYDDTDQTTNGCFYYPVYDTLPGSIELLGECDESIQAQADFDVAAYLGRWYEIARYPQPFEDGQCARAQYNLGTDGVDVINTIVINQTLGVQLGSAVVLSTDGSGLLEVTFVLEGGIVNVANYYVLETDYNNYALVYSCRNLGNGYRQVSSWKLSRQPTLDTQYNQVIDAAIDNTQGLLEEYYTYTSQSDEDCFYIPEVNEAEAVVFRGQCEDINGVQGFNVQAYLGWWHEIERFPTGSEAGDCISSQISASGNQYVAVDTEVFDLTGTISTNALQISANGVLTKTLANGETIEYIVLATDYETYSLLYSCVNIDSETRRVWSAKHSKSRQLTAASQTTMQTIIDGNSVLYSQFYIPVDQSDSGCFHYPEQTGQQIILPGQCDENIAVEQNFDAVAYTGTWYQIEKYPQVHETGDCTGARYSLDEATGVVDVLNWEVINGELDTIEGTATIISTDGSAKLEVILPLRGTEDEFVTYNLYVLGTDYASYSLAYSCQNVNQFQRAVGAWKLSRTRTMPAVGTAAINSLINQLDELHQPYFVSTSQSEECEEPSSGLIVKSSLMILLFSIGLQFLF